MRRLGGPDSWDFLEEKDFKRQSNMSGRNARRDCKKLARADKAKERHEASAEAEKELNEDI